MITSKINLPIPGGWAKEAPEHQQSDTGEDSVAAGVVSTTGEVVDEAEKTVAKITEGKPKDLVGNVVLSTGEILNDDGSVVGKAVPADSPEISKGDETSTGKARSGVKPATDELPNGTDVEPAESEAQDKIQDELEDEPKSKDKDEPLDTKSDVARETKEAKEDVTPADDEEKLATISNPDDAIIKDDETAPEGLEKDAEKDVDNAGKRDSAVDLSKADINSQVDDAKSTATGQEDALPLPDPFEKFPGAQVNEDGKIIFDDQSIGVVAEGDIEKLAGKTVDAEGNIRNEETGTVIGKGELKEELQEELKDAANDFSILKGTKVNKGGNLVNDKGQAVGRITEGILKHLIGKKADENGQIWNESGKVIGKAEPIPDTELEELKDRPFEDFPDAVVGSDGKITSNGEVIGRLLDGEGDAKKLKGKKVDSEGEILDSQGNVIGKAERWEEPKEPEPEPEPEADRSILAGKRVNKAGNIVDSHGQIFGRVVEGDAKRMVGRMCDKKGNILSESGDILGKGEVVPEGEREGYKEGPFSELSGCTVSKDGKVVTPSGDVVGRLIKGDAKALVGRPVDEDGDILDRNGNSLGRAERWEEPVVEKSKNALSGRKVNREGNVLSPEGDVIGKLTSGDLQVCSGQEIDDDGDVVNGKGATIGHVSLLADIPEPEKEPEPEPEPTETPEEKTKREEAEKDEKLAKQMSSAVQQCLDRVRPICKLITQKVEAAERKPKEELDEDLLVKEVKPLIEEGNKILTEANGVIRALDPDGHIQNNAKSKSHTRDASPAEYHLADVLKELTGTVTECIDNAKKKIEGMPHAKKELNPLWGLMTEPLFQILAAVGLLLNGVLELVGRLLSGLGLGGIVNNLLGGLGLTNVLKSLGAGGVVSALTGQNKKK